MIDYFIDSSSTEILPCRINVSKRMNNCLPTMEIDTVYRLLCSSNKKICENVTKLIKTFHVNYEFKIEIIQA